MNGKNLRNIKNSQISKEPTTSSSSSLKNRAKYRYNLRLSTPLMEETTTKKNLNQISTIENGDTKDNIKKLKITKTNDSLLNISKALTSFHSGTKPEEKENKEKAIEEKDNKEKENKTKEINVENNNDNNKDIRKRMNFRERLNDSRKKRAFFINNNNSQKNSTSNINNNNNINNINNINININDNKDNKDNNYKDSKCIKNQSEEKNMNQINNKEEQKIRPENNRYNYNNIIYKESHSKKRRKKYELIKENKQKENENLIKVKVKENAIKNIEKDIKEENLGNEIKDTVKCHICEQKMVHPKMCPKCHNISCEKCLYNWFLKDQNKECFYCKEPINFYEFISVPFMDTIVDFVEKVIYDKKKYSSSFQNDFNFINKFRIEENAISDDNLFSTNDNCDIHENEKIHYYCLDCNKGYCKTCFVFFGNEKDKHLNHKIIEYSNYKKLNLPSLGKHKDTIDLKEKNILQLIKQYNSYKKIYEFQQKTINDYISFITKEFNNNMDNIIKNIDNKISELNKSLEVYQKAKNEIDEFYKKLNIKNRFSTNAQYLIDKIEKITNKEIINENEKNELLTTPDVFNFKIYKSKNIEYNADINKYLNKIIKIENDIEMIIDNKNKNCLNININILKNQVIKHLYKVIVYVIQKEENIINAYLIDDMKEGKNYYSFLKKIQLEEKDFSLLEIKTIIYDMYFQ